MAGDLLIAIAGLKATEATFVEMLSRHPVGAKLSLHWFRQQRLLTAELELRHCAITDSAVVDSRYDVGAAVAASGQMLRKCRAKKCSSGMTACSAVMPLL